MKFCVYHMVDSSPGSWRQKRKEIVQEGVIGACPIIWQLQRIEE